MIRRRYGDGDRADVFYDGRSNGWRIRDEEWTLVEAAPKVDDPEAAQDWFTQEEALAALTADDRKSAQDWLDGDREPVINTGLLRCWAA